MAKRVEIILGKDGSVKSEAFGFKGASCMDATKFLNKCFGDPANQEQKSSFFDKEEVIAQGLPSGYCG